MQDLYNTAFEAGRKQGSLEVRKNLVPFVGIAHDLLTICLAEMGTSLPPTQRAQVARVIRLADQLITRYSLKGEINDVA